MAILFNSVGQIEHGKLQFVDAVVNADVLNGAIGNVEAGVFTAGAKKGFAIMQQEVGDKAGLAEYPIAKGTKVRVLDMIASKGQTVVISGHPLPSTFKVGDKLESDENGALVVNESEIETAHFVVKEVIGKCDAAVVVIM